MTMTLCLGYTGINSNGKRKSCRLSLPSRVVIGHTAGYPKKTLGSKLFASHAESLNALLISAPSWQHKGLVDASRITSPQEAASAMRNVVRSALKTGVHGQALIDAPTLASITETLCKFVPKMNTNDISDVMWGMGTLIRNRERALLQVSDNIQTNYRAGGKLILSDRDEEKLRDGLEALLQVSITTFHRKSVQKRANSEEMRWKLSSIHLSKLLVGIGRMSGAGITWSALTRRDSHCTEFMLELIHQGSVQDLLSGGKGQPLANVLWPLAKLGVHYWHLPPSLQALACCGHLQRMQV